MRVPLHVVTARREELAKLLQQHRYMPLTELCARLKISVATARRDLAVLARDKVITRTRGGALVDFNQRFPSFRERQFCASLAKRQMALTALKLIKPGLTVFLDAGTTTYAIAEALTVQPVPGITAFPSPVFDIANNGVMRDSLLSVHGGSSGSFEKDVATRYDRKPTWDKLLTFDSTCNTGIRFGADVGTAAILFTQPNNRVQPIQWYYGATNAPAKVAALTVSRETGDFNFSGGLVTAGGISGGDKAARNLRGKNVAVNAGDTHLTITFPVAESDGDYAVFIEQSWIGQRAIVKKGPQGFTVQFEKPAPAGGTLDWLIVR